MEFSYWQYWCREGNKDSSRVERAGIPSYRIAFAYLVYPLSGRGIEVQAKRRAHTSPPCRTFCPAN